MDFASVSTLIRQHFNLGWVPGRYHRSGLFLQEPADPHGFSGKILQRRLSAEIPAPVGGDFNRHVVAPLPAEINVCPVAPRSNRPDDTLKDDEMAKL